MSEKVNEILEQYRDKVTVILQTQLSKMLLYGSYARGDFCKNSDIDIMILVKSTSQEEIRKIEEQLCDLAFDIEMESGFHISAFVKNEEHFIKWQNHLPFYTNVKNEGIELHTFLNIE